MSTMEPPTFDLDDFEDVEAEAVEYHQLLKERALFICSAVSHYVCVVASFLWQVACQGYRLLASLFQTVCVVFEFMSCILTDGSILLAALLRCIAKYANLGAELLETMSTNRRKQHRSQRSRGSRVVLQPRPPVEVQTVQTICSHESISVASPDNGSGASDEDNSVEAFEYHYQGVRNRETGAIEGSRSIVLTKRQIGRERIRALRAMRKKKGLKVA